MRILLIELFQELGRSSLGRLQSLAMITLAHRAHQSP